MFDLHLQALFCSPLPHRYVRSDHVDLRYLRCIYPTTFTRLFDDCCGRCCACVVGVDRYTYCCHCCSVTGRVRLHSPTLRLRCCCSRLPLRCSTGCLLIAVPFVHTSTPPHTHTLPTLIYPTFVPPTRYTTPRSTFTFVYTFVDVTHARRDVDTYARLFPRYLLSTRFCVVTITICYDVAHSALPVAVVAVPIYVGFSFPVYVVGVPVHLEFHTGRYHSLFPLHDFTVVVVTCDFGPVTVVTICYLRYVHDVPYVVPFLLLICCSRYVDCSDALFRDG